jgi:hypothetical protein
MVGLAKSRPLMSHRKSDLGNLCRSNLQKDAQIGLQGRMSEIFPDVSLVTQSQSKFSYKQRRGYAPHSENTREWHDGSQVYAA